MASHFALGLLLLAAATAAADAARANNQAAHDGGSPSRLSLDFSSSLIVAPDTVPASAITKLNTLLARMADDGVNTLNRGRLDAHVSCEGVDRSHPTKLLAHLLSKVGLTTAPSNKCTFSTPPAPQGSDPCACTAGGGKTRCSCSGRLTGDQYFNPRNYDRELARILVVADDGKTHTISGGINANHNSTVRLDNTTLVGAYA